jgi:hypothetical protein
MCLKIVFINFIFFVIAIVTILIFVRLVTKDTEYSDEFETNNISSIWHTDRMEPESYKIQSSYVRHGKSALKITIHKGDKEETNKHGKLTERDELSEQYSLYSEEGEFYEYCFSMFLPKDFPIVPTRLVLAQWKQRCPKGTVCDKVSPVIALRYQRGELRITLDTGNKRRNLWRTQEEIRNKWLDFRFKIMFSRFENGLIHAYLNNKEKVIYKGITSYKEKYYDVNTYYFKMGLYRDRMVEPMSIYIDSYSKKVLKKLIP